MTKILLSLSALGPLSGHMPASPKAIQQEEISVDFLPPEAIPAKGRLGMSHAPGLETRTGKPDPRVHLAFLKAHHGIQHLVCLMEKQDLAEAGISDLIAQAKAIGMKTDHFPIPDGGVPGDPAACLQLARTVVDAVKRGDHVLVHCHAGLGRTGLFVATCLVMAGHTPEQAIRIVRKARPGTIETKEQEAFVLGLAKP